MKTDFVRELFRPRPLVSLVLGIAALCGVPDNALAAEIAQPRAAASAAAPKGTYQHRIDANASVMFTFHADGTGSMTMMSLDMGSLEARFKWRLVENATVIVTFQSGNQVVEFTYRPDELIARSAILGSVKAGARFQKLPD